MEVLSFYWPNILAGMILVLTLSTIGQHIVPRNQSMDIMLLGQEFQTGVLIAAIILSSIESGEHSDHGLHMEMILTICIVLLFHFLYSKISSGFRQYKIELSLVFIVLLMGLSHLVVLLSPIVEFHMMKSYLGDIVTISKVESFIGMGLCLILLIVFNYHSRSFSFDTLEMAIFNKPTKLRKTQGLFNIILLFLMLISVHLFGTIFTVGSLIIPSVLTSLLKVSKEKNYIINIMNMFCVPFAFFILSYFDRIPTTVAIIFFVFINSLFFSIFLKTKKSKMI